MIFFPPSSSHSLLVSSTYNTHILQETKPSGQPQQYQETQKSRLPYLLGSVSVQQPIMCHGIPRIHPCQHTSIAWSGCPVPPFDLHIGRQESCPNVTYGANVEYQGKCTNNACDFHNVPNGCWWCCRCSTFNTGIGWCEGPAGLQTQMQTQTFGGANVYGANQCDHTCCTYCARERKSTPLDIQYHQEDEC